MQNVGLNGPPVRRSPGQLVAEVLGLAATPVFFVMAALTIPTPSIMPMPSMTAEAPLSSMALSYVLMGVFHTTPWVRLLTRKQPERPVAAEVKEK